MVNESTEQIELPRVFDFVVNLGPHRDKYGAEDG